jgi:uncharacterized protein (TIGR03067 family)
MRSSILFVHTRLAIVTAALLIVPCSAGAETADNQPLRDDFDSQLTLDWETIRPDPTHVSLKSNPGKLTITTQYGSIHKAPTTAKNLFLIDLPNGIDDFVVTTCIENFLPEEAWQQAGLLIYDDDDNYIKWGRECSHYGYAVLNIGRETEQIAKGINYPVEVSKDRFWLRISKRGNLYQCAASLDGKTFTTYGVMPWGDGSPKKVGLLAKNGNGTSEGEIEAQFDFFELRGLTDTEKDDPTCAVRHALLGKWKAVDRQISGKPITKGPAVQLTVQPGTLTLQEKSSLVVSYTVDPTTTPNRITLIPRQRGVGPILNGIFSLEGDTLVLCLNPKLNGPAPDTLKTTDGDGHMLLKLQRVLIDEVSTLPAREQTFQSTENKLQQAVAPFHHIDLQPQANHRLADDFPPGHYAGDGLSELKKGVQKLGGISFHVGDGLIEVAGKFLPDHPKRVDGIEVGRHIKGIHILHGARWGAYGGQGDAMGHWVADGTPIGYYEVNYADAETEAIPLVYGIDVRDWWSVWDNSKPTKRGQVAWTGSNPHLKTRSEARHTKTPLRLYLLKWENPHPESLVTSINMVSLNQTSTPFCVAMTVEDVRQNYDAEIRELETKIERLRTDFQRLKLRINGKSRPQGTSK